MCAPNVHPAKAKSVSPWGALLEFHQRAHKNIRNGEAGLAAIQKIHELLGSRWNCSYEARHLLKHRPWTAHEPGHDWLIHFSKKLEIFDSVPGSRDAFRRLDRQASYWGSMGGIGLCT